MDKAKRSFWRGWLLVGICSLGGLVGTDGQLSAEEAGKKVINATCPFEKKPVVAGITSPYTRTVKLCCMKCQYKFEENPDAYAKKLNFREKMPRVNALCPVSGEKANSSYKAVYEGKVVGFANGEAKAAFVKDPEAYASGIRSDHAENASCPVASKSTEEEIVSEYTVHIGFCSEACKKKHEENPEQLLGRLR